MNEDRPTRQTRYSTGQAAHDSDGDGPPPDTRDLAARHAYLLATVERVDETVLLLMKHQGANNAATTKSFRDVNEQLGEIGAEMLYIRGCVDFLQLNGVPAKDGLLRMEGKLEGLYSVVIDYQTAMQTKLESIEVEHARSDEAMKTFITTRFDIVMNNVGVVNEKYDLIKAQAAEARGDAREARQTTGEFYVTEIENQLARKKLEEQEAAALVKLNEAKTFEFKKAAFVAVMTLIVAILAATATYLIKGQ